MNFRCAAKRFIAAIVIIVAAFMPATAYPVRAVNYRGCCDYVYVGGEIIGFEAKIDGVLVTDAQSVGVEGWQIKTSLKKGDVIKEIEGEKVAEASDIPEILEKRAVGGSVRVLLERNGCSEECETAVYYDCRRDCRVLGVEVKDGVCGLGTVTYTAAGGEFCGLGHEISDFETGYTVQSRRGRIFTAAISGINKSVNGSAGSVKGYLTHTSIGMIEQCGKFGIRGRMDLGVFERGDLLRLGGKEDVTMGSARICSSVSGKKEYYDIKIIRAFHQSEKKEKSMIIKVVDRRLIEITGGIIQGMSGSPIVQNGTIVGAITHVFTGDATMGYGVYADWQR